MRVLTASQCLASQGVTVRAYDVYPPSLEKAVAGGCKPCKTPADAVQGASLLGLMVVNVAQVEDLLFGEPGVAAGERDRGGKGLTLVKLSPRDQLLSSSRHAHHLL